MAARPVHMVLLPGLYAVCRLPAGTSIPTWGTQGPFWTVTSTADEVSVTCEEAGVPPDVRAERGFRVLKLVGPLDFSETGIVAGVAGPLAAAGVSIVPIATYDTDYILIRADEIGRAIDALRAAGHTVGGM